VLVCHGAADASDGVERPKKSVDVGGQLVATQLRRHCGSADEVRIDLDALGSRAIDQFSEKLGNLNGAELPVAIAHAIAQSAARESRFFARKTGGVCARNHARNSAGNSSAQSRWAQYDICPLMLGVGVELGPAIARLAEFNQVLEEVCTSFNSFATPNQCKYDGGAVFITDFAVTDVSTVDYFHPSAAGQRKLAAIAWGASFWPTK